MKQLLSVFLVLSLSIQPLLAQSTTAPGTPQKTETPAEAIPIEDLLPADTLAYVATSNLAALQHSFELLDAFKVARARLPKDDLDSDDNPLSTISHYLSFGVTDPRVLEGARVGVAVIVPGLPDEVETEKVVTPETATSRAPFGEPLILFFLEGTRLDDAQKAREQLLTFYHENYSQIGKLSDIKQTDYKGHRLDRFKDGSVGLWFGATYVLSQQAAIDRLITLRADRRTERLADDQEFLRTKTQMMPQTGLFAYVNGKPLNRMAKAMLGSLSNGGAVPGMMSSSMLGVFSYFLIGTDGIQSAALSSTFDREGVVDRLVVNLDPAKKNLLKTLFTGPKSEFKSTALIPAGTEVLFSHSIDWVKLYDDVFSQFFFGMMASQEITRKYQAEETAKRKDSGANKEEPAEVNYEEMQKRIAAEMTEDNMAKAIKQQEAKLNQELGFDLREELSKDLGNEITVAYGIPKQVVAAVDSEGEKKDDEGWAVFIGIKDRAATQQALIKTFAYFTGGKMFSDNAENSVAKTEEQLKQEREQRNQNAQSAWAMMPTEVYKKVEIKSVFAAYLGFSDEYMMVADSKETIKQMLDLSENGRALASDYNYSRAVAGMGSAATKMFVGPKMFDGWLNNFIKDWSVNPSAVEDDPSAKAPLNVPATIAAAIDGEATSIKLEAYSPLGVAGTAALWGFGDEVKRGTARNEEEAADNLRELAKAEKAFARKNRNRYATLETLTRTNKDGFSIETFKADNYKLEFRLKPGAKGYEATATPVKYGRQGRRSFFIDESGQLRSADKQGAPASVTDKEEWWSVEAEEEANKLSREKVVKEGVPGVVAPPPRPAARKR